MVDLRSVRILKIIGVATLSILLFGCKVSDSSSRAPGVWYGIATDELGEEFEVAMFINNEGEIFASLRNGFFLKADGLYQDRKQQTEFQAAAYTNYESADFVSINKEVNIEIEGQLADESGVAEIRLGQETLYSLLLARSNDPVAQQAQFAGTWRINPEDPNSVETWTINDVGELEGQDPLGCNYTGYIQTLDNINIADITMAVDSCEYEGVYEGIMSLFTDPNSDGVGIFYSWANEDRIFVNGLEKILEEGI